MLSSSRRVNVLAGCLLVLVSSLALCQSPKPLTLEAIFASAELQPNALAGNTDLHLHTMMTNFFMTNL